LIRLFNVYYPVRTLILLAGEALIVWTSFVVGTLLTVREDSWLVLNYEYGYYKIGLIYTIRHDSVPKVSFTSACCWCRDFWRWRWRR